MGSSDLDRPQWLISQLAKAAGLELNTLRSWFQRGHFSLGGADEKAELGMGHLLSTRSALRIAVAVELYAHGMHPAAAAKVALAFTDLGGDGRDPGELYPERSSRTILVVHAREELGSVLKVNRKTAALDLLWSLRRGAESSVLIIDLNAVDRRVRARLASGE